MPGGHEELAHQALLRVATDVGVGGRAGTCDDRRDDPQRPPCDEVEAVELSGEEPKQAGIVHVGETGRPVFLHPSGGAPLPDQRNLRQLLVFLEHALVHGYRYLVMKVLRSHF